ncbi:MAG TPA: helix-turn-helix domain-containing protein [Chromatiales bacterium]|nr:helix-turn-helix domain-containing protein [Chromatiales bacterium]
MVEHPDSSRESADPPAPPPGPGERLRRAREAAGLEPGRVAAELHLAPAILEALERDDFGSLPPTYIQGYLRSYAKRLGLAADSVLADYHRRLPPEPPPTAPAPRPTPAEVGLGRPRRGLYVLLGVLAVAVFLTWWFRGRSLTVPSVPPAAVQAPAPPRAPAEPARVPVPGPLPVAPVSVAPMPGPAVRTPVPRRASTPASGELVLRCRGTSWVEVRDASGRRLVYDLLHAGEVRRVSGTPPFRVLLGNAAGVQLEWDGRPVPLPHRPPGKVVQITVGAAPTPRAP